MASVFEVSFAAKSRKGLEKQPRQTNMYIGEQQGAPNGLFDSMQCAIMEVTMCAAFMH